MDGSDNSDLALIDWLNIHQFALETHVENGGRVWLNVAPNSISGEFYLTFGMYWSDTLELDRLNVTYAPDAKTNPVYQYPTVMGYDMVGSSFAHGYLKSLVNTIAIIILLRIHVGLERYAFNELHNSLLSRLS